MDLAVKFIIVLNLTLVNTQNRIFSTEIFKEDDYNVISGENTEFMRR